MMQHNPLYRTQAIQKQQNASEVYIHQVENSRQFVLHHGGQQYNFLSHQDAERYAIRLGVAKPLI